MVVVGRTPIIEDRRFNFIFNFISSFSLSTNKISNNILNESLLQIIRVNFAEYFQSKSQAVSSFLERAFIY